MESCVICLEKMEKEVAILECGHSVHFDCLTEYQVSKKSWVIKCPLCRKYTNVTDICDYFLLDNEIIKIGTEKYTHKKIKKCVIL